MKKNLIALLVAFMGLGYAYSYDADTPQEEEKENPYVSECVYGGPGYDYCTNPLTFTVVGEGNGGGCSITCIGNYYACCTMSGCKCVPIYITY
ncbi:MAG: hypothetical protein LUD17_16115 [Bacteroidales bacterium]|nr:hypothetical protein [Bacteroidales bacterium]